MTRTATAPGQSAAASSGSCTSETWLTEVCRPSTFSPDSIRSSRTCPSALAAGEPGTVVAASAAASAVISARSRAVERATTTLTKLVASLSVISADDAVTVALAAPVGDEPPEGLVPEPAEALTPVPEAAPSAHAGLCDTSPRAGPQAARQKATSIATARPQARERPRRAPRPVSQRMAAGSCSARLAPPRPLASRLSRSRRGSAFDLDLELGLAPGLPLEPTVRVGVRAAARKQPAASRAPSGSSMGEVCPSCGARAARSRALGRSAESLARASVRRLVTRLATDPFCPAHSVKRRARA